MYDIPLLLIRKTVSMDPPAETRHVFMKSAWDFSLIEVSLCSKMGVCENPVIQKASFVACLNVAGSG